MNTHTDKAQITQSRSVAHEPTQKSKGSSHKAQIINNRPEAAAQLKLQEMANEYTSAKSFQLMKADPVPEQFVKHKERSKIYKIDKVENDKMYITPTSGMLRIQLDVPKEKWGEWEETTNEKVEADAITPMREETKPTAEMVGTIIRKANWWIGSTASIDKSPDSNNKDGDIVTISLTKDGDETIPFPITICVHLHVKTETGALTAPGHIFAKGHRDIGAWRYQDAGGADLVNYCLEKWKTSVLFPKKQ